jgi:hypothetical protein
MLTLKKVTKALPTGFELVKGEGYYYFAGPSTEGWHTTMVCVYRLNDLTLAQWLSEFESLKANWKNH